VRSCRAASARIVPCAFAKCQERERNINFEFSWEYPVSRSAKVSSLYNCTIVSSSILEIYFFFSESHTLATGGPDCTVRVWNPFVSNKVNVVLPGHRSTICALVVIDTGKRIYSLSKDRCIKVWDVPAQNCIQV